ncbi:hypothetical protein N7478_007550 [Penicillium angulare]|uniref:uncharacterized protein n=1 Tax=Penicillium angulare TaxID=116970 RepID=UPI00253FD872|nr:uncharacterized protein N7478_007550 [Penicillium angulare]KAJ5272425.1 hypothetical protein N7478_007550 [Penicillium angulare]
MHYDMQRDGVKQLGSGTWAPFLIMGLIFLPSGAYLLIVSLSYIPSHTTYVTESSKPTIISVPLGHFWY